jgi:hypothetical protein
MIEGAKDVTQRILDRHIIYGASDNTQPAHASSNKSLNYAAGGSITSPERQRVSIIPFHLKYNDTVGLFGKENHFVRVDIDIDKSITFTCFEEDGWECGRYSQINVNTDATYVQAIIDEVIKPPDDNTFVPAELNEPSLYVKPDSYITIDLANLKTGNKYIDSWFDVRLYTKAREEHPYNVMYVRLNDFFYIGFHARNTRRLPYNVSCLIGRRYETYESIPDKRLIMKR